MGERKVLNKYVPPDFDPSLVPRGKKPKDGLVTVRMMLPFTVQCATCSTFLYRGRKFNSKKEAVGGPEGKYLGIQKWRFYIKCTACSRPITFMTDPQNADYEMEGGGTRNYEVYKDKAKTEEEIELDKETDEKLDPMKALENRVLDSQREMEDFDNLEEIKAMNMRHHQMSKFKGGGGFGDDAKAILVAREAHKSITNEELNEKGLTESEEAIVKTIKFGQRSSGSTPGKTIWRLGKEDEKIVKEKRRRGAALLEKQQTEMLKRNRKMDRPLVPVIKAKRRRDLQKPISKKMKLNVKDHSKDSGDGSGNDGLIGLLGAYESDSD